MSRVVLAEERQFARVMELGSRHLDELIASKAALENSAELRELVGDLPGHERD